VGGGFPPPPPAGPPLCFSRFSVSPALETPGPPARATDARPAGTVLPARSCPHLHVSPSPAVNPLCKPSLNLSASHFSLFLPHCSHPTQLSIFGAHTPLILDFPTHTLLPISGLRLLVGS
jgi:hypothetical protein